MTIGYSMDALVYDSGSNTWSLRADYDLTQHRVDFSLSDNDSYLDGDFNTNETGDDSGQTGSVYDMDGNLIDSGQYYSENYYELTGPGGEIIRIDVIEIGGQAVGYVVSAPLVEGVSYDQTDADNVYRDDDEEGESDEPPEIDTRTTYSALDDVPCFCQGTVLAAEQGDMPVDWIRPGDRVLTKDHGYQAVLWVGRSTISAAMMRKNPALRPIRIAAHSVGPGAPAQDLQLSPEHRVLLCSAQIELLFGVDEAFAPVKSIMDGNSIGQMQPEHEVSYYHILFQHHEIVLAEGLWVESFFPGKQAMSALSEKMRKDVCAALGSDLDTMETARTCLRPWEVALLQPQLTAPELLQRQVA